MMTLLRPRRLSPSLLCALAALTLTSACASTKSGADGPAKGDEPEEDEAAELAQKLEIGKLELDLARLEAEQELHNTELALEFARAGLAKAKSDQEAFLAAERALEVDVVEQHLDASKGRADDAAAELTELEAMYAEEEFATKTKELVITRSRRDLELSRRSLELARRRKAAQDTYEHPAKERDLAQAVKSAEKELLEAEQSLAKKRLATKIALAKAEQEFAELEKKAEKAKAKKAKKVQA
jgi:hypothetical protein